MKTTTVMAKKMEAARPRQEVSPEGWPNLRLEELRWDQWRTQCPTGAQATKQRPNTQYGSGIVQATKLISATQPNPPCCVLPPSLLSFSALRFSTTTTHNYSHGERRTRGGARWLAIQVPLTPPTPEINPAKPHTTHPDPKQHPSTMAAKRVRVVRSPSSLLQSSYSPSGGDSPQIDNVAEVAEGSPPRAAESEEGGGGSGKDEVAPPKGDSALLRSGSGSGSGNAAAPDGLAKSPMKPEKRVTALPLSDQNSRENLAKSPSNEVPALQEDEAAQDDHPESPPKSKKNRKKKKALRAGDSGKVAAPDGPAEPTHPQQDVGQVDGRLAESEQEVPPKAGKAKKKASAQARKKPSAKQHAAQEEDGDLVAKTEEEVAPQQGGEEDGKGSLPQRKSKRIAALSGNSPPYPKRNKIVDAQKPGFRRKWNGNDEIMILEALVDQIRNGENVPQEPDHPLFHELAQRLEGRTFNHNDVREKVRSLKRRYNDVVLSGLAITKDHDLQLHELSCEIWGRSTAHAGDKQRSLARDKQSSLDRDEHKSFARDEEKSVASDEQRSFDEMCKQFPLLAKEIKVLVEGQPAIMELFPRLDGNQVVAIEKKLENLRWIDMKRKKKMAVKMAKIRKGLIYKLEELRP